MTGVSGVGDENNVVIRDLGKHVGKVSEDFGF